MYCTYMYMLRIVRSPSEPIYKFSSRIKALNMSEMYLYLIINTVILCLVGRQDMPLLKLVSTYVEADTSTKVEVVRP